MATPPRVPSGGREISIGLLWHSAGAGNLGVGALTVGNLIAAREAAAALGLTPRFTILEFAADMAASYLDDADIRRFVINARSMVTPGGYWAELGRLDCVLDIGAGDSFTDIYGAKRFAYLWATKELAFVRGVPLVFSPQTIGPFTRQPYRLLAGEALRGAAAVVVRDPESAAAVRELARGVEPVQSIDVAFRLPFTRPTRRNDGVLDVGVNVSGLLFNGGYGGGNDYGLQVDYAALMRRFIGDLAARADVRVHLVCHVNSAASASATRWPRSSRA